MVKTGVKVMNSQSGDRLPISGQAQGRHGALVMRAAAVLDAPGMGSLPVLADTADVATLDPRRPAIVLERGAQPALARMANGKRHVVRYADPLSESALAAIIACATAPGMPIAADPESLSILALAERLAASDIPVLINGPTGTGKEVLSRFIHAASPAPTSRSLPSTAPPCPKPCWKRCCSATRRAPSPAPARRAKAFPRRARRHPAAR
jgi:two-component system response regulator FlrC